jgi:outer membrane protein TolC
MVSIALHGFALMAAAVAAPREITLDEALHAAEATPDVVAARASESVASANIRLARAPGDPSLSFQTHSITARESLALSIPFRWAGQRSAGVRAAKADLASASYSRAAALATARHAARVAWYTLAASEDRYRTASEQVARSERTRSAIAELLDVQRASKLDEARAATDAASATAALAKAEQEVTAASAELRALLGTDDPRLSAGTAQPTPPPEGDLDAWRERALNASPELAAAASSLEAAEERVTQRSREKLPALSLETGADWNDPTQPGTDAMVGLGITFPMRGRATLDVARAERDRAAAQLDLARRRVAADVESAWSAARAARLRFEVLDGIGVPAAVQAAEMTRFAAKEGRLDLFRLLDSERALNEAQRDRAEAYRDWGIAYADLTRLAPEAAP